MELICRGLIEVSYSFGMETIMGNKTNCSCVGYYEKAELKKMIPMKNQKRVVMNKICFTPSTIVPWLTILFLAFILSGCSGVRYDDTTRKYSAKKSGARYTVGKHDDGSKSYSYKPSSKRYTIGQYDNATARYSYRMGDRADTLATGSAGDSAYAGTGAGTGTEAGQAGKGGPPAQVPEDMALVIDASNVLFDFDKAVIKGNFYPELNRWAEFFLNNPEVTAEIFGHADSTGPTDYNQKLSERRALAVVNYLVAKGVERSRLTPIGFGEMQPAVPNTNRENRQKNRRVELNF